MKIVRTLCTMSTAILLSLGAGELLAAEASKKATAKQSGFTLIDFSHRPYLPELTLSGFYGDKKSSYGGLDILYPIYQSTEHIIFVDLRGVLHKNPVKEFNLGTGYRWLNEDASKLYGAYLFYDRKMSLNKNWFSQVALGGELKTTQWSLGANVYVPVGTTEAELSRVPHAEAKAYPGDRFTIDYGENVTKEYAMQGLDAEFVYTLPWVTGLSAYLGGYYFKHKDFDAVTGPKAGVIYDVAPLLQKALPFVSRLEFETSFQHDKLRGSVWYAGMRMSIPLGSEQGRPQLEGLEKDMTRFVRRDLDVVLGKEDTVEGATWTKPDGTPYVGKIVTTPDELTTATTAGSGIDIIGVKGAITVTGDGYSDGTTKAAVNLSKGQSITGLGLSFDVDGLTYNADIVNSANGITYADPSISTRGGLSLGGTNGTYGHLIHVYTEESTSVDKNIVQRIEDLELTVPEAASGAYQKSAVISNALGQVGDNWENGEKPASNAGNDSFGKVVIDNVKANGIIDFMVQDERTGDITVQDSELSVSNPNTGWAAVNTGTVAGKEDAIKVSGITNNTIEVTSSVGSARGLFLMQVNGPVSGNTFGAIMATGTGDYVDAQGIYVLGDIVSGGITNNTFAAITTTGTGADKDDAVGIWVQGSIATTAQISGNKFNGAITTAGDDAVGVVVNGDMAGTIKDNTFDKIETTAAGDAADAVGIWVQGSVATTAQISGNKFTGEITSNGDDAYGIYVYTDLNGVIGCASGETESCANTFNKITTTSTINTADAAGIRVSSMTTGGEISGNKFNMGITSAGDDVFGVYVDGAMAGTITKNIFDKIETTGEGTGDGAYANGIRVGSITTGEISLNKFNGAIISAGADATGVWVKGAMAGTIKENNFAAITTAGDGAHGVYVDGDMAGTITGNTFDKIGATRIGLNSFAHGIYVVGSIATTGEISFNNFNGAITTTGGRAYGIRLKNTLSGSISKNTFSRIRGGDAGYAYGISINGDTTNGSMASDSIISDNRFEGEISARYALGVWLGNTLSGSIINNTFTLITGADEVYGIYQYLGTFTATNVTGNTFNVTDTNGSDAYGISLPNATAVDVRTTLVGNNTFSTNLSTDEKKVQIR